MAKRELGKLEDCPSWCVADHTNQAHLDDAVHWGDFGTVAAIEMLRRKDAFDLRERNLQIDIGVERRVGSDSTCISITVDELDERSMLITVDSARRLSRALARAVAVTSGRLPS